MPKREYDSARLAGGRTGYRGTRVLSDGAVRMITKIELHGGIWAELETEDGQRTRSLARYLEPWDHRPADKVVRVRIISAVPHEPRQAFQVGDDTHMPVSDALQYRALRLVDILEPVGPSLPLLVVGTLRSCAAGRLGAVAEQLLATVDLVLHYVRRGDRRAALSAQRMQTFRQTLETEIPSPASLVSLRLVMGVVDEIINELRERQ